MKKTSDLDRNVVAVASRRQSVFGCWLRVAVGLVLVCVGASGKADAPGSVTAHIVWNPQSLTLIQRDGVYGRIACLKDGELLCAYSLGKELWARRSWDNGTTWREAVRVADWSHGTLTNAELLPLANGTVLCFFNRRPDSAFGERKGNTFLPKPGAEPLPFAIGMAYSENAGQTWQPYGTIYLAGAEFGNGCWEPAAVQLPSGEIQLFFANQRPYRQSGEQEITLLRSRDNAQSWSKPETISFRAGHRDGMPVPLVLQSGKGIAVAIEDNGLSGDFKPVIVLSARADNWRSGAVTGASSRRWSALRSPLAPQVYAGAPYLRQMPTGETVLSFQQSDTGDMNLSRMAVCIGDGEARNFGKPSYPFPHAPGTSQLWNALFVKDRQTIMAISQAKINGVQGLWSIDGRLLRGTRHK